MSASGIPTIEFLRDKVYLGAFATPPPDTRSRVHFTIDEMLPYNNFHHDFGPLSVAHLYRFTVMLHEILGDEQNKGKAVVFYSGVDPRLRANAACMLCSYMVVIQNWPPHLALAPIAQAQPPLMPFRDAGYSVADFVLTVQDVVYSLWRAKQAGLLDLKTFNLEEYEHFELVENGDLNLIAPHFIAFASPVQKTSDAPLSHSFRQVLDYFEAKNVKLVVRLNSHLYDSKEFERRGMKHMDMIFEDGTCPSMAFVQGFIGAAQCVIRQGGRIAVHCRAGLGRTGCLIGAHLIYTYAFTAQEAIAYMRFLRPGMVVGPQQHWLYLHQNEFREWKHTMTLSRIADDSLSGYCALVPLEIGRPRLVSNSVPRTPERSILSQVHNTLPGPTPGQPRKSPVARKVTGTADAAGTTSGTSAPAPGYPRAASQSQSLSRSGSSEDELDELHIARAREASCASTRRTLSRQLRTASNPSPRRRQISRVIDTSPLRRTARIASVHK